MAFKVAEIFTRLSIDSTRFDRGMRGAKSRVSDMTSSLKSIIPVATIAFAAAGAAAVKFLKDASAAEETASKFDAVFKEEAKTANSFAKALSERLGRSLTDVKDNMANLQDTFVPLGFGRKEARQLSQRMAELAIDVASFKNESGGAAVVSGALTSALVGNNEAVKKYGIILNEANVRQKAFEITGKKFANQLTDQEKVMARYELILAGTTDAHGDAERTSGSLANQWRKSSAMALKMSEDIGKILTPTALQLMTTFQDELLPQLREFFSEAGGGRQMILGLANAFSSFVKLAMSFADSSVGKLMMKFLETTAIGVGGLTGAISGDARGQRVAELQTKQSFGGRLNVAEREELRYLSSEQFLRDIAKSNKETARAAKNFSSTK